MVTAARMQWALDGMLDHERTDGVYCKEPEEHKQWHVYLTAYDPHVGVTICSKCLADQINGPTEQILEEVNRMIRSKS